MLLKVLKKPKFENDDILLYIENFNITSLLKKKLLSIDDYLRIKYNKFLNIDLSLDNIDDKFRHIPSFKNESITRTIYTHSVSCENNFTYKDCLNVIKKEILRNNNRRVILRFLNSLDYYITNNDVSCLAYIQYMMFNGKLNVNIVYRASDVRYELYYDIVLIYLFFIKPIRNNVNIRFYSSTAQNVKWFNLFLLKFRRDFK